MRARFRKSERVRYISHLDVLRAWERAIRRAGLPLSYSQGFTPHPKLAFAGPLPLGFASEAEVMDITLDEWVDPEEVRQRLEAETSPDLALIDLVEVAPTTPPPQANLLWADYRIDLPAELAEAAETAVREFLAKASLEWTEERREKARTYDLRGAVAFLQASVEDGRLLVRMRLRADAELTARPEQVLAAMLPGVEPMLITRTGLVFEERSPAREAWRRKGQYEG